MSSTSLRRLDRDLYCIDHDFRLAGVRLGGRTSIVRMADDALLLHSPGPITDADEASISAAGSVGREALRAGYAWLLVADGASR